MHAAVYQLFQRLCHPLDIRGAVLEIGAVAGPDSLLRLPALQNARRRVGLNQEPQGAEIRVGNANHVPEFADGEFDVVLSNATLEHDPYFWKTLDEMKRLLAPGGILLIGIPGYGPMPRSNWLLRLLRLEAATPTLGVHNYPGDYYRFSQQAVREIFLEGLNHKEVHRVLTPPRYIGIGRKP